MTSLRISPSLTLRINSPSTFCASPIAGQSTQQAGGISSSLNNLQAAFSNQSQAIDQTQKDSNNWLLALGGALLAMALAGGGIFISRRNEPGAKNKQNELSPPVSQKAETIKEIERPETNTQSQPLIEFQVSTKSGQSKDYKLEGTGVTFLFSSESYGKVEWDDTVQSITKISQQSSILFNYISHGRISLLSSNFGLKVEAKKPDMFLLSEPGEVFEVLHKDGTFSGYRFIEAKLNDVPMTRDSSGRVTDTGWSELTYKLEKLYDQNGACSASPAKPLISPDPSSKQMFQRVFKKEDVFVYASVFDGQPNRVRYPISKHIGLGRDGFSSYITAFKSDPRTGLTEIREENGQKFLVTESIATNSKGEDYLDKGRRNCRMMIAIKVAENFQLEDLKDFPADWRQQIFNHIIEQYEKQFTLNRDEVTFEYPDEFVIQGACSAPPVKPLTTPDSSSKQTLQRVFQKEDVCVCAFGLHQQPSFQYIPTIKGQGKKGFPHTRILTEGEALYNSPTEVQEVNGQKFLVTEFYDKDQSGEIIYRDKKGRPCRIFIAIKVTPEFTIKDIDTFPADWRHQIFDHVRASYEEQREKWPLEPTILFQYPDEFVIQ